MSDSSQMAELLTALSEQQRTMAALIASLSQNSLREAPTSKASVPSFPPFDRTKETWDVYFARLGQHFEAHRVVSDNRKRAFLLSWVGSDTFELLQKLFSGEEIEFLVSGAARRGPQLPRVAATRVPAVQPH
ncbi:hypothetical protein TTRE_0000866001 [Trichuris trichiura]|uniref:Uncharacterized protein n=1 Tax=Trichuris trichiura TaxID=36087 RepID=A0A077ZKK9_TRITR|nr:hypothetical protein TTRE_0000866001 [Trichuris trichiura]